MEFVDLETSSRIVLNDGRVLTRCDQCRQMWADRGKPLETPCDGCRVDLLPENEGAAMVYLLTRRQVVLSPSGQLIDLSIPAVKAAMDIYAVQDQRECLLRVMRLFHHFMPKGNANG